MSFTIDQAFVQQFSSTVTHLAQQRQARLLGTARTEYGVQGESHHFERLSTSEMMPKARHGDTTIADDTHSRRLAVLKPFEKAHLIDKEDKARTLINPDNEYSANLVMAKNRRIDRTIHDECLRPTTTTAIAAGSSGTGLTFGQVNAARQFADVNEWDEEERFFGYTARGMTKLLEDAKLTSADYNVVKALVSGTLPPETLWMGFRWRRFGQGYVSTVSANIERCFAWQKGGIGLAFSGAEGGFEKVRVDVLPGKSYATQVYCSVLLGGQVIDDALVLPVNVDVTGL